MADEQARQKVIAAEHGCQEVDAAWEAAFKALTGDVSVNWYGVYSDPASVRAKFATARDRINEALQALERVQWPSDADYDNYDVR